MNYEQAKDKAKASLKDYLISEGIDPQKNFRCLSGTHEDKNPSMSFDPKRNKIHCFSCGADMDIFDLFSKETGLTGASLFDAVYKKFGIIVNEHFPQNTTENKTYKNLFEKWHKNIIKTQYPQSRGLSEKTINRFNLGYCDDFQSNGDTWKALIIPTGSESYCVRNTDPTADKRKRYTKRGSYTVFNENALYNSEKPVYIVEGEIDAMSIVEGDGEALALSSTSKANEFIDIVKKNRQRIVQPLIIALDNDDAGRAEAAK